MSRTSRAGRTAIEQRARLLELLGRLTPAVLEDLDRRARFVVAPDGFGSTTGGEGVRGSEVSRPTEAAVVARSGLLAPDPVGEQIRALFGALSEAAGVLGPAGRWLDYLQAYGDRQPARESSLQGDCVACERPVAGTPQDRLRSGLCQACYESWRRWSQSQGLSGDPGAERRRFIEWRRERVGERPPVARVTPAGVECPHACCSRVVEHEHWHSPSSCPECAQVSDSGGQVAS